MINRDKELAAQALSMFQDEDLCHFSNEHERVVIDALRSYVGWQPMETAPKDMAEILIFTDSGGVYVSFYNGRYWEPANIQSYDAADIGGEPTHWMPLPDAPETEDD